MITDELIITVNTANGDIQCNVIAIFSVDQKDYIALLPINSDEIIIVGYIELEAGGIELFNIESENEFNKILDTFDSLIMDTQAGAETAY